MAVPEISATAVAPSITQSMSRGGHGCDNAPMDRLFKSLKTKWHPGKGYMRPRINQTELLYIWLDQKGKCYLSQQSRPSLIYYMYC